MENNFMNDPEVTRITHNIEDGGINEGMIQIYGGYGGDEMQQDGDTHNWLTGGADDLQRD